MMMQASALFAILLLMTGNPVFAAKGNGAPSPAAQMQSSRSGSGGGGGGGRAYMDPRKAPPLDPSRKVSEQDCSRPVDLTAGNLKCK
jgi:hypothetical protein